MPPPSHVALLRRVRVWIAIFIVGLVLSGITAFPLERETALLCHVFHVTSSPIANEPSLHAWLRTVHQALADSYARYPFLAYGTDWLAFAHIVIAVAFIGPLIDPVRNKWVIAFGVIACIGVLPLALIAGPIRGIPFYWRLIDCSFGIFGAIPLLLCLKWVNQIERTNPAA